MSLTADGSALVTVAADALASVWLQPRNGGARPRRLTSSKVDGMYGLTLAPDGRVVYVSRDAGEGRLWTTSPQTGERSPLPGGEGDLRSPEVTSAGRIFCVARTRSGGEIREVSPDGAAPRVVTGGVAGGIFAVSREQKGASDE